MLRHWSQFVPNMSTDIRGHEALHHPHLDIRTKHNMRIFGIRPFIKIQTHKRFKRTFFIRTKHNMRIFGVIPFIKFQTHKSCCFLKQKKKRKEKEKKAIYQDKTQDANFGVIPLYQDSNT